MNIDAVTESARLDTEAAEELETMKTDLHISESKTCWEMRATTQSKDCAGEDTQKGMWKKQLF